MTDQQKQLLENWEKDLEWLKQRLLEARDIDSRFDYSCDIDALVQRVIEAREAKTREEERGRASLIISNTFKKLEQDPHIGNDWCFTSMNVGTALHKAQQQILSDQTNENE